MHTLVPQVHFHLQGFEVVGQRRAGLCAHLLVGPLLQAIEFLVDVHGGGGCCGKARAGGGYDDNGRREGLGGEFIDMGGAYAGGLNGQAREDRCLVTPHEHQHKSSNRSYRYF